MSLVSVSLDSLMDLVQHTVIPNPPDRYIGYYLYPLLSFINIGNIVTYQSCILWSRSNHYCVSHSWIQQVRDFNIQSFHGWWHHPWIYYSWHSSLQYPRAPRVLPLWFFSCALRNMLPRCSLSWFPQGYIHYEYTGYQYPYIPPCTSGSDDEYKYVFYKYLFACSSIVELNLDYPRI